VADLEALGAGWGRVSSTFRVADRGARHALLKRSVAEGWTDQEVQKKAKALQGKGGGGGRPRRSPRSLGRSADLDQLVRLAGAWRDFQEVVWSAQRDRYARELGGLSAAGRGPLRRRCAEARAARAALRGGCDAALAVLVSLENLLGAEAK
jgi:hypothetical protein